MLYFVVQMNSIIECSEFFLTILKIKNNPYLDKLVKFQALFLLKFSAEECNNTTQSTPNYAVTQGDITCNCFSSTHVLVQELRMHGRLLIF